MKLLPPFIAKRNLGSYYTFLQKQTILITKKSEEKANLILDEMTSHLGCGRYSTFEKKEKKDSWRYMRPTIPVAKLNFCLGNTCVSPTEDTQIRYFIKAAAPDRKPCLTKVKKKRGWWKQTFCNTPNISMIHLFNVYQY